MHNIDNFGEAV